jgi:hypothetical protein
MPAPRASLVLRSLANELVRPYRWLRPRARRERRYWRKHELGWVVLLLVLSRRDTPRSRVLVAIAEPDIQKLYSRWPGRR